MTAIATVASEPGLHVRAFVRRLRRARACSAALRTLAWTGLPLLALLLITAVLVPGSPREVGSLVGRMLVLVFVLVLSFTTIGTGIAYVRVRRLPLHHLVRGLAAAGRVPPGVLADELATWIERGRRPGGPMTEWLEVALAGDLASVPSPEVRRLGRRRLGRLRYLLPICIVLLLALLVRFWSPPVPGLGGSGSGSGGPGKGEGAGTSVAAGKSRAEQRPSLPPPPEPPPEKNDPPPPVQPEPPAPVLPLPLDREFVVPQFIDDGPSRRELARVAEVPQGEGAAQGQAPRTGGGAQKSADTPATGFARAEERALRARHVPEAERPMVQRFFARLREGKK